MSSLTSTERRHFLRTVVAGAAALTVMDLGIIDSARAAAPSPAQPPLPSAGDPMGPIRQVRAGVLDIGYFETGPGNGQPVLLLHGFPFDIHSYAGVAPMLAEQGYRVIVPYLRGHGPTRFLDATTPRSGQQGANGAD